MRDLLLRGGIVLTASPRAARALDRRFAESQQADGVEVWPSARIYDLHSWLLEQWGLLLLTGAEGRILLNELQERALWQRILIPQLRDRTLIQPASMADLAQEAYRLLADYHALDRLRDQAWISESMAEPELFRRWAQAFQDECAKHTWLPRPELTAVIAHGFRWGALAAPSQVGLLGFDMQTPAERNLFDILTAQGTRCTELRWQQAQRRPPQVRIAASEGDEVAACAAWARAHRDADPGARIGILLPDLAARRAQLERELYRTLAPQAFPIASGSTPPLPFEFSLGQPLANTPPVHAALLLLRWLERPLPQQQITWLLLSRTLHAAGTAHDRDAIAQWDARLRNASCAPPQMSLVAFLRSRRAGGPAADALHRDLDTFRREHDRAPRTASAGGWSQRVQQLLHTAGWTERRDTSSLVFQVREAWLRLLDTVASLDVATRSMRFGDFLDILELAAQESIFSPESEDAPVQVMGAYAAAGQSFDAVWFLGATETAWPAAGRPNPLLPLTLQRECGMPHATPADEHALVHRLTERILANAGEVVFSYAVQSSEAVQRGSSLIAAFATDAVAYTPGDTAPRVRLESIAEDHWVPFLSTDAAAGGHSVLKAQADCPFQAFMVRRLRARDLPIAGRGLSAAERGNLLHAVLQGIWSKQLDGIPPLRSHADLVSAFADHTLRPRIDAHIDIALAALRADIAEPWQRAYVEAERIRVADLLMDWLEYERRREPFTVAVAEEDAQLQLGDLILRTRPDRIDHVADGHLLIDYKSGEVSPASWDGDRPEQPQLPLYAAFGDVPGLVGALFAQVRQSRIAFKGRILDVQKNLSATVREDGRQIAPYTPEVVAEWREVLQRLADSFLQGEAAVDPRTYPKTCQFCPLPGVCRVAEMRAAGLIYTVGADMGEAD